MGLKNMYSQMKLKILVLTEAHLSLMSRAMD